MKKKNSVKIVINVFLVIFILLSIAIFIQLMSTNNNSNTVLDTLTTQTNDKRQKEVTLEEILEKHEAKYIDKKIRYIYVTFPIQLYDKDGNKNNKYFENLVKDLSNLAELNKYNFKLIDEENNIEVEVTYDTENDEYIIKYNGYKDFYEEVDGELFSNINNSKIIDKGVIQITSPELDALVRGNMFFLKVKDYVDEGTDYGTRYKSFNDGKILMKIINNKVRNIVFTNKYEDTVVNNVKVGTNLADIEKYYSRYSGGSVDKGVLYYRTDDIYIFFYDNEISAYGYSYFENTYFEDYLEEYLQTKDLDKFVQMVTRKMNIYDEFEYNPDIGYAHITYPSMGIEINIKDNNPNGITLYNNYYLTDKTKKMILEKQIQLNSEDDLLLIAENERRKAY